MWTRFWDMHSGGGQKEEWNLIFIEAPEAVARVIFYNRFGHNAGRVTCTCCGPDYSVVERETLMDVTGFHRGLRYTDNGYVEEPDSDDFVLYEYMTMETFEAQKNVLIIRASEIQPWEREGPVPVEGYVWV